MSAAETVWGSRPIPAHQPLHFELGALRAEVEAHSREWAVRYRYQSEHAAGSEIVDRLVRGSSADDGVSFAPRMATRNVMARMDATLRLPVGATATIYVSSPVWAQCTVADDLTLFDLPTEPVSMAWFGPSTIRGQLCVSEQTRGRLQLTGTAERPDRIITPITIANGGVDALMITRLNIPAPTLPVFLETDSGLLWTSEVTITREEALDAAELDVADAAPGQVTGARLLSPARVESKRSRMKLALDLLFA